VGVPVLFLIRIHFEIIVVIFGILDLLDRHTPNTCCPGTLSLINAFISIEPMSFA